MTYTESSQKHRVQQQDHTLIWLMVAMEEDSEDEAVEDALYEEKASAEEKVLAMVTDQSLVIIVKL